MPCLLSFLMRVYNDYENQVITKADFIITVTMFVLSAAYLRNPNHLE